MTTAVRGRSFVVVICDVVVALDLTLGIDSTVSVFPWPLPTFGESVSRLQFVLWLFALSNWASERS